MKSRNIDIDSSGRTRQSLFFLKIAAIFLPVFAIFFNWWTDEVKTDNLLMEVNQLTEVSIFETQWIYFYLVALTPLSSFLGTLTLRGLNYYKSWKYLFPALFIVGAFFVFWDILFTVKGVWGFNPTYYLPISLFHLPLEEWSFFIVVPFACVAIYECLNFVFGKIETKQSFLKIDAFISVFLILIFFGVGLFNWSKLYTSSTFLLTGSFLLYHYLFISNPYRGVFYLTYLISWLPFSLVNGILTGGYTKNPVVIYNPEEYLGIRLFGTIPLEDSIYSFLLLLMNITLFEYFRQNRP